MILKLWCGFDGGCGGFLQFVDDFNGINLLKKRDDSSLLLRTLNIMMMIIMIKTMRRFYDESNKISNNLRINSDEHSV